MTPNCMFPLRLIGDAMDLLDAQRRIEMCIAEIKAWMVMFILKLNDDKTEINIF